MEEKKITLGEIWKKLSKIKIKDEDIEKKNGLSYLSWVKAWRYLIETYDNCSYSFIYNEETKMPYFYDDSGAFVRTTVTVEGLTLGMQLPVMDHALKPMKTYTYTYPKKIYKDGKYVKTEDKEVDVINSFAVNKNLMRCLTKNIAMFGLGVHLYEGEDIPNKDDHVGESWETKRLQPIGGKGSHKDESFAEVPTDYLNWCMNSSFQSLKKRANMEYEYRKEHNISITKDGEVTEMFKGKGKEKKDTTNNEKNLLSKAFTKRVTEVLDECNTLFIDIFKKADGKMHKDYKKAIANSKDIDSVNFISLQIKAMEVLLNAYQDKSMDKDLYASNFKSINRATIDQSSDIEQMLTDILNNAPSGSENEKLRNKIAKSLQDEIDSILSIDNGYHEKHSINSMKKHLGVEDVHACFDIYKLQEYLEHIKKNPPKAKKESGDNGVPFKNENTEMPEIG